jgi:small subunit ribosomal protein S6
MREYELYLVLDGEAEEEQVDAIVERTSQMISAGHADTPGEVIKVDARGRRRLAYAIRKKREGLDYILTFHTPPPALPEIERYLKLDEQVLRYLLVRKDDS